MPQDRTKDLRTALQAALEYIDALPADTVAALPGMPGFDRDWVDELLAAPATPEDDL